MANDKGNRPVKHTPTAKVNIPMCIASILFCLTLISVHLTSGLYAKYISRASGSDFGRVITFGDLTLTETGDFYDSNKLMIIPGVHLTKKATVSFTGSEAATYVFVEITPSASWQTPNNLDFSVTVNSKTAMQWRVAKGWSFLTAHKGSYVYYRELIPNATLNDVDIIADNGQIMVSDQITQSDIVSMTGIFIKFRATVVQAGGFANTEAAWNSVAAKIG